MEFTAKGSAWNSIAGRQHLIVIDSLRGEVTKQHLNAIFCGSIRCIYVAVTLFNVQSCDCQKAN